MKLRGLRFRRREPMHEEMGMDRRALIGLLAGLAGMAAAVAGALFDSEELIILAGTAALSTGALTLSLVRQLHEADTARDRLVEALAELQPSTGSPVPGPLLDAETGLPDEWFFHLVLEGRIAAARRQLHPLSIVLLQAEVETGEDMAPTTLNSFVALLRRTLREADTACRTGTTSFAVILERTPEEGGVWAAERIQLELVRSGLPLRGVAAAVATYPTHGLSVDDVLRRARKALAKAAATRSETGLGRVEIASADRG